MRSNWRTLFGLLAAVGVATSLASAGQPGQLMRKGETKVRTPEQLLRPVSLRGAEQVKANLRPIPAGQPIQHYVIGVGQGQGSVAGGEPPHPGVNIYSNTGGQFLFPPGEGVQIADDIRTICAAADLTFLDIGVGGGGDGTGAGFDVTFEMFTGCPTDGGLPIAGTLTNASLENDGNWIVTLDLSGAPLGIGGGFWVAVTVSTNLAGWIVGNPADIGNSDDIFDGPFPCTTFFGGWPANPHASFYVDAFAVDGSCLAVYKAYEADAFSGFFTGLELNDRFADEMLPISAPANCELAQYNASLAGLEGAYTMHMEIWSDDEVNLRAFAPVLGTQRDFTGLGNGFLETAVFELNPPIPVETPLMWITYDVDGNSAGPILVADFPDIGFSDDCFAIFDNPDPDVWSQCVWFFGGCPQDDTGNPCATFQNTLYCTGTEPSGACCDLFQTETCRDDVPTTQCDGRFVNAGTCATDPFDPPCGTAACCKPDETCENLDSAACDAANGQWQPGAFCGEGSQSCPPPACITATQPCDEVNNETPGCTDGNCCTTVCGIDNFCCTVVWDDTCVSLASDFCPLPPPDTCQIAEEIACNGSLIIDNTLGNTTSNEPGFSCHNAGAGEPGEGAVWAKFVASSTTARVSTCNSDSPADDSLLAVYSGTCDSLVEIGCSDDVEGCQTVTNFNSDVCVSGLIPGQTYYVQLAAWTNADRGQYNVELECPAPATCGPPPPPANDNCANALPLVVGTTPFTTLSTTTDGPALPAMCDEGFGVGMGRDIWYNYTAVGTGTLTVDLCTDTDYDSRLAVYTGVACPAQTANTLECDDDGCSETEVGVPSKMTFPVTAGQSYKLRVGGFGANEFGTGTMIVTFSGTTTNCPAGAVTFTNPLTGTVDARQPNPVNSLTPRQGISTVTVTAPMGADDGCWTMCETASSGGPNSIQSVTDNGAGTYTITLARPITPGAVTRVAYTADGGAQSIGTFIFHPSNVNGDSAASPVDILRIIDCLNGINPGVNCPWGLYSQDIDQSGVLGPADILRVIDLLNGADVFDPWNGTTLPSGACNP